MGLIASLKVNNLHGLVMDSNVTESGYCPAITLLHPNSGNATKRCERRQPNRGTCFDLGTDEKSIYPRAELSQSVFYGVVSFAHEMSNTLLKRTNNVPN